MRAPGSAMAHLQFWREVKEGNVQAVETFDRSVAVQSALTVGKEDLTFPGH